MVIINVLTQVLRVVGLLTTLTAAVGTLFLVAQQVVRDILARRQAVVIDV